MDGKIKHMEGKIKFGLAILALAVVVGGFFMSVSLKTQPDRIFISNDGAAV